MVNIRLTCLIILSTFGIRHSKQKDLSWPAKMAIFADFKIPYTIKWRQNIYLIKQAQQKLRG